MNWHRARVSNGPAEAINNLVKRAAFGFRRFAHYRIRALLYARQTELGAPRHRHSPLKTEAPLTSALTRKANRSRAGHPPATDGGRVLLWR